MEIGALIIMISSFMLLCLLACLAKFLYNVWWNPTHIQKLLASQGIRGPSYKKFHGNTKEIQDMERDAMKSPMKVVSHDILPRVQPHIHLWRRLYGRNFLKWHGYTARLVVTEPDLVREILTNNREYVKPEHDEYVKRLLGDGLFISEGKKWSKQRKLANHAFSVENLKNMVPAMLVSVTQMLERWGSLETKEIEMFQEFRLLTADVISRTAFGSSYQEGQKIFDMVTRLVSMIAAKKFKVELPLIGKFVKFYEVSEAEKLEHEIRKSFLEIIRQQKQKMQTQEFNGSSYLGLLIKAHEDTDVNKRISMDDVIDECKTFYFAGHETTMGFLTWITFLLAIHTDWQEKARKEVFEIFGKRNPTTEDNGFGKMKTMTMIMNETLRLYPSALSMRRRVASPVKLGKYLLPADIDVLIPPLAINNDPEQWGEDVHLFKPERFAEGFSKAVKNYSAFLPFGMGPHMCVGLNFATIEVKIALSMILQRYVLSLSPSYAHSPIHYLTTRPQHGVQIIINPL